MRIRTPTLVAALAVIAAALAASPAAHGCSCTTDDAALLASAGTVVVGTVERVDVRSPEHAVTRLRVERVVNGTVGGNEAIDVHAPAQGGGCGLEVPVGQRTALALERSARGWESNLCGRLDRGALLAAADSLPAAAAADDDDGAPWPLLAALATLGLGVGVAAAVVVLPRRGGEATDPTTTEPPTTNPPGGRSAGDHPPTTNPPATDPPAKPIRGSVDQW